MKKLFPRSLMKEECGRHSKGERSESVSRAIEQKDSGGVLKKILKKR